MAEAQEPVTIPEPGDVEKVVHNFDLEYELQMPIPGPLTLKKYKSKRSGMTAYFVDMDTQVINAYFCLGTDQPEAIGIEQLLHQLDSSGGLLPRAMRGDMLRPAWQFHGAENPLADRDESCYVCCALGESAFLGTFSCSLYLLQNLEAVLELHGFPYPNAEKDNINLKPLSEGKPSGEGEGPAVGEDQASTPSNNANEEEKEEPEVEPTLDAAYYSLSEAGEGAMAWEATLQAMFPGVRAFWNRLLNDGKSHRLGPKMRRCFDSMYRPENLSVIVTGAIKNYEQILEMLTDHETDYFETHQNLPEFTRPWTTPLPPRPAAVSNSIRFISRNPLKTPSATIWSMPLEKFSRLHCLPLRPTLGAKLVTAGYAHRISWCQLEYKETCSLITIHALPDNDTVSKSLEIVEATLKELTNGDVNNNNEGLNLKDIKAMADRPAAIAKAERYGEGSKEQVDNRICPRVIVERLLQKPREFWLELLSKYFISNGHYLTQVVPVDDEMMKQLQQEEQKAFQEKPSTEMQYAAGSRRAASKPRRKSSNAVGEESNVAVDEDGRNNNVIEEKKEEGAMGGAGSVSDYDGPLEEQLKEKPFPFGDHDAELENFEQRMEITKQFLNTVRDSQLKYWSIASYESSGAEQHPLFSLKEMPMHTFLDDTNSAFVYITVGLDTTGLDSNARRLLAPVTAALGAFVCPRPPALDTDSEIEQPNEFNPPLHIADSQVSLGLNGESTQNVFLTIIVRPEKYKWAVGLLHHILYETAFSTSYLRFIAKEAVRGLAANYKMQKAESPNYECFDSGEVNLHGLINLIYKEESNARLFVGRRRLDLMMQYLDELENQPEAITKETNEVWNKIVGGNNVVLQVAGNIAELAAAEKDLVGPWKSYFSGKQKPNPSVAKLTSEPAVMLAPAGEGVVIELTEPRAPCLSLAIPINPNSPDFPKLCMAAQLFSMAQKWTWSCWGLDDVCSPVLRMPCSYANLITLNLECIDVMGCLMAMKMMIKDDWPWLETLLTATKLMVINDPATLELGAQGSIMSALLSHINGQTVENRRNLLKDSMNVTVDDIKEVINKHLVKLFDPASAWCSLMVYKPESEALIQRIEQLGFKLKSVGIDELCKNI
ncbi:hypothetical protein Ocin01_02955 [Orchesella cincta]|uniref:Uncharacterized protein n=1 Tax=Orchesella cincta TaxID=48709 RepID=A0A1D2NER1_ORCCI|nr:hypothetical protein Ocin01_02955 [Orchesella cincta]